MTFDPRPDLVEDGPLWTELLARVLVRDGETATVPDASLFGALHALRCEGARLKPGVPRATIERSADYDPATWRGMKIRWLGPYRALLESYLTELMVPPKREEEETS